MDATREVDEKERHKHINDMQIQRLTYLLPVQPQLALPLERRRIGDLLLDQLIDDVTRVHLDGHQGDDLHALHLGEVGADGLGELGQHRDLFLLEALQRLLVAAVLHQTQACRPPASMSVLATHVTARCVDSDTCGMLYC